MKNYVNLPQDMFLLLQDISKAPETISIVLGGSRCSGLSDEYSDYDIYIYSNTAFDFDKIHKIIMKHSSSTNNSNMSFGCEDDIVFADGTIVEIISRTIDESLDMLYQSLSKHIAKQGFSTVEVNNILNGIILYDKDNKLQAIRERFDIAYPQELKNNIISLNRDMLHGKAPSIDKEILKSLKRKDYVTMQRWCNQFLSSYFDILFAINEKYHTGENKMLQYALDNFSMLPKDICKHVNALCIYNSEIDYNKLLEEIITNLDELIV